MSAEDLLVVRGLLKSFGGQKSVNHISFSLTRGSMTGLIGPNGAGKTTLFNCLAGFLKPSSGSILLDGNEIAGLAPHDVFALGLARTFQIPRPFAEMSLLENLMVGGSRQLGETLWNNWLRAKLVRNEERQLRESARYWLNFMGLSPWANEPARVLSGGQRKLLELARAMMSKPRLMLLDEPGAGLNPILLDQIAEKISRLNAEGASFLIIEHNMDLVASLCNPVLVMAAGDLIASGPAKDVLSHPKVVAAYLGTAA